MTIIKPDILHNKKSKNLQLELLKIGKTSIISAYVGIKWQGVDCLFTDWSFIQKINLWQDYLPPEIKEKLAGLGVGDKISQYYQAGELLENYSPNQQHTIPVNKFQPPVKDCTPIFPLLGRYYSKDYFVNVEGIDEGHKSPCRITSIEGQNITVDMNHPLAGKDIELTIIIDSIKTAGIESGDRRNDITAITCDKGPGMQDRLIATETDFFSGTPFSRLDQNNDADFFKEPDLSPFWDSTALRQVSELYNTLIPQKAQVLDLMAGVHSPLQDADTDLDSVICAGLNEVEMLHNPRCNLNFKVDVNSITSLPFNSQQFDTVLVHAAIEYVINPELIFAEINRVLKPSGRVIISFSNRSITEKTIKLWTGAHEFERSAIVLSYLRSKGQFCNFQSYSKRGELRPKSDKNADKLVLSDPVYIIWADKTRL